MNEFDQIEESIIDSIAKLYAEAGATGIAYAIHHKRDLTKKINEAIEKHRYRQAIPLLGDEQKEITP